MASLRDLAQRALREAEHPLEQDVEPLEQCPSAVHRTLGKSGAMEHRSSQKTAKNWRCSNVPAPMEWNAGTLIDMAEQVSRLPCPPRVDPHNWRQAVVDCQHLVSKGWALQALYLGWTGLDLFGAVPDKKGDPSADGLAVKLNGRRVLAICGNFAIVADANGGRSYLKSGNNEGAQLLWQLGR